VARQDSSESYRYERNNNAAELVSMLTGAGQRMHLPVSISWLAGQRMHFSVSIFQKFEPNRRYLSRFMLHICYVLLYTIVSSPSITERSVYDRVFTGFNTAFFHRLVAVFVAAL